MVKKRRLSYVLGLTLSVFLLEGCNSGSSGNNEGHAQVPVTQIDAGDIFEDSAGPSIKLPSGEVVEVSMVNGIPYIPIGAVIQNKDFDRLQINSSHLSAKEKTAFLNRELKSVVNAVDSELGVLSSRLYEDIGYFVAYVNVNNYNKLGQVKLPYNIAANPIVTTQIEALSHKGALKDPRETLADYEGLSVLEDMEIQAFQNLVQNELGVVPTGSNVKVGIIDSGITMNHPTFNKGEGETRIEQIFDSSNEGFVYFHPKARFSVTIGSEPGVLDIDTQVLAQVQGARLPDPSMLDDVKVSLTFDQDSELYKSLITAGSGAKLGVFSETSYVSADIDGDGASASSFYAIYLPGATIEEGHIFVSFRGADFRGVEGLSDWNATKDSVQVVAESLGFIFGQRPIGPVGSETNIIYAGPVGIDESGHGTDVAGIAAGQKLFTNDSDKNPLTSGVATEATIVVDKVCLSAQGCVASTEAMARLASQGASVVNLSLGSNSNANDGYNVSAIVADRLTHEFNTLFVFAAGNSGPGITTVAPQSTARLALSVGATSSNKSIEAMHKTPGAVDPKFEDPSNPLWDSFVTSFSSRGPAGDGSFNPDVVGPGIVLSAQPLNTGFGAGSDVLQGTSMASPAVAGAVVLLLDAARIYNEKNPSNPLPTNMSTIRRVLKASALPFNVTTYELNSNTKATSGKYTWVDQGAGMVNLPRAWNALKAERDSALATGITYQTGDEVISVRPDYEVRISRTNPNGVAYTGAVEGEADKYARGIWFKKSENLQRVDVYLARRIPANLTASPQFGSLKQQLLTTVDRFLLKTTIHGSSIDWVYPTEFGTLDCTKSKASNSLLITGEGAADGAGPSPANDINKLPVCINNAKVNLLPPGDHGAIINAYRVDTEGNVEANPSFEIPVYLSVPNVVAQGETAYEVSGSVRAYDFDRHYVEVPEGTTSLTVTIEVEPISTETVEDIDLCSVVLPNIYQGNNSTADAAEWTPQSFALNCLDRGSLTSGTQDLVKTTFHRLNPTPGTWNIGIEGWRWFANNKYKLRVDFAQGGANPPVLATKTTELQTSFDLLLQGTNAEIDFEKSVAQLESFVDVKQETANAGPNEVSLLGENTFAFPEGITAATISTRLLETTNPLTDLDLIILQCPDATGTDCAPVASSAGPTSNETATIVVDSASFYQILVDGYAVPTEDAPYELVVALSKEVELQSLEITAVDGTPNAYQGTVSIDSESGFINDELFQSDRFTNILGNVLIVNKQGMTMFRVPIILNK